MRPAVILSFLLLAAHPAAAQQSCEASVTGKPGEVMVAINGADKLVSWAIEPKEGVGTETPHFSRPGILLDFNVKQDGKLVLAGMLTTVTRISDRERGQAPALSTVKVRAKAGAAPITWEAEEPETGEAELVKQLKARWPETLQLEVMIGADVMAASTFDLSALPEAEKMARDVLGKCSG